MAQYPDIFTTLKPFDGDFDAFKLQADNCDVIFASYPKGTSIPTHNHETDNYGIIISGKLILTVDGCVKHYGLGDWYHVPANKNHSAMFEQDTSEIEFWFKPKS